MSDGDFLTLAAPAEAATKVRGSTFLAVAAPAADEESARRTLDAWARPRFDATHHCHAWRFRGGLWRANDDGEPTGSAGAPILAALDGAAAVDAIVVVTRWYGGTKLGVGGLIRAYGDAAALALAAAPKRLGVVAERVRVEYGYEHTSAVMRALDVAGAAEPEHGFTAGGARGVVEFTLPSARLAAMRQALTEASAGALSADALGARVLYHDAV